LKLFPDEGNPLLNAFRQLLFRLLQSHPVKYNYKINFFVYFFLPTKESQLSN